MEINCKAWNPSKQETRQQARWLALEYCKEPFSATDNAIDSLITALRSDGCNPEVITTITIPLDEYRLLISDAQIKAREEGCKEGREESWDLSQRVHLLPEIKEGAYGIDDLGEAFGTCDWSKVTLMPVEEALAKDKRYQEEKKALHIGDEVEFVGFTNSLMRGYVMRLDAPGDRCVVILQEKGSYHKRPDECIKTGKHNQDIEKVMASFEKGEKDDDI